VGGRKVRREGRNYAECGVGTTARLSGSFVWDGQSRSTEPGRRALLDRLYQQYENHSEPAADDGFSAAVQAIMTLPLNDAEKAEAVRRMLAGR
jgi:hypothetical protein